MSAIAWSTVGGWGWEIDSVSCRSRGGGDVRRVLLMVVILFPAVYDDRSSGEWSQRVVAFWWCFYMEWHILLARGMLTVTSSRSSPPGRLLCMILRQSWKSSSILILALHATWMVEDDHLLENSWLSVFSWAFSYSCLNVMYFKQFQQIWRIYKPMHLVEVSERKNGA